MAGRLLDCFTFYNELDLLELRLRTLDPYVTSFVLVEATRTFSGQRKELFFEQSKARFRPYLDRIIHVVVDDMPTSSNPWELEAHQRNAIGRGLKNARPDDVLLVSDVDEIPKPNLLEAAREAATGSVVVFGVEEYNFKLDLRVNLPKSRWIGPRMIEMRHFYSAERLRRVRGVKTQNLPSRIESLSWQIDTLRSHGVWLRRKLIHDGAWHFSFVMHDADIAKKLSSYSHREFATPENLQAGLGAKRIAEFRSFFGHELHAAELEQLPVPLQRDPKRWHHLLHIARSPNVTAMAS